MELLGHQGVGAGDPKMACQGRVVILGEDFEDERFSSGRNSEAATVVEQAVSQGVGSMEPAKGVGWSD